MSQRIGMADGRCITEVASNRIMTETLMQSAKIAPYDNYAFRQLAQAKGPDAFNLPLKNAACRTNQVQILVENE